MSDTALPVSLKFVYDNPLAVQTLQLTISSTLNLKQVLLAVYVLRRTDLRQYLSLFLI